MIITIKYKFNIKYMTILSTNDIKNVYYINLDNRIDRKNHVEKQLTRLGWNGTRFPAIKHPNGALGCSLSHLELLKYAKQQKLDHILIIEDDIVFKKQDIFISSFNNFLQSNIDYDVVIIAGNNIGGHTYINDYCVKVTNCQTTTAYLVKEKYYDTLINNFENGVRLLKKTNMSKYYTIDQYWKLLQKKDRWFLITPLTVSQLDSYSNIEKKIVNYDRAMLTLNKNTQMPQNTLNFQSKPSHKFSHSFTKYIGVNNTYKNIHKNTLSSFQNNTHNKLFIKRKQPTLKQFKIQFH